MEASILMSLLTVVSAVFSSEIATPIQNINAFTAEESAEYIASHFNEFKTSYNQCHENPICADKVVAKDYLTLVECGSESDCYLLKFNGDYGFAVVGANLTYYLVKTYGNHPLGDFENNIYGYSTITGFVVKSDGEWCGIEDSSDNEILNMQMSSSPTVACSGIEDLDSYVKQRYGTQYEEYIANNIKGAPHITQNDLSLYRSYEKVNGYCTPSYESNCWYFSAFIFLQCMQANGYGLMPSFGNKLYYNLQNEEARLYNTMYDSEGNNISGSIYADDGSFLTYKRGVNTYPSCWVYQCTFRLPVLYAKSRQRAFTKNYKLDDGSIWQTSGIIEEVAKQYGYKVNVVEYPKWSNKLDTLMTTIISGRPFIWSVSKNSYQNYGYHTMAGYGYSIYKQRLQTGSFTDEDTKFFLELRDGWENGARWFDATGYKGHIGSLSFIKI